MHHLQVQIRHRRSPPPFPPPKDVPYPPSFPPDGPPPPPDVPAANVITILPQNTCYGDTPEPWSCYFQTPRTCTWAEYQRLRYPYTSVQEAGAACASGLHGPSQVVVADQPGLPICKAEHWPGHDDHRRRLHRRMVRPRSRQCSQRHLTLLHVGWRVRLRRRPHGYIYFEKDHGSAACYGCPELHACPMPPPSPPPPSPPPPLPPPPPTNPVQYGDPTTSCGGAAEALLKPMHETECRSFFHAHHNVAGENGTSRSRSAPLLPQV